MSTASNTVDAATRVMVRGPADEAAVSEGCRFDPDRARRVRNFFRAFLRHSKGQWAGQPFDLLDWQWEEVIKPLFGWRRPDGTRRFRITYVEVPKKNGKALSLDTPIPTPRGWTMQGDLQPGDEVFDEAGHICRIVAVGPILFGRPCHEVIFSDRCRIVADAEHEWMTSTLKPEGKTAIVNTRRIAETLMVGRPNEPGRFWARNHTVLLAAALHLPEVDLPIPPYVLGCWLGDGHEASARLTCAYEDGAILQEIAACGVCVAERPSPNEGSGLYLLGSGGRSQAARDLSLQAGLRRLGVLGKKHIPAIYLRGSIPQRLALLQGLMDTDGHATKKGQLEYTTTRPALRDGFLELARTLGLKPSVKEGRAVIKGKDCGPKWRIQFWAFEGIPAFRLSRKRGRQKPRPGRKPRSMSRQIVSADPVRSVPVRCVQVDSPSGLYLAGESFIPTHNSTLASGIGLYLLVGDGEPGAEVYSVASSQDQAMIVHGEALRMVEASSGLSSYLKVNHSTRNVAFPKTNSWYRALSGEAGTKEGLNAHGLVVDELHAWSGRGLWDALKYAGRSRRQPLRFVITTAGDDMESVCREQHDYAKAVLSGEVLDTRFFPYIRAAASVAEGDAEDDDWTAEATWHKANPSLGVTINLSDFRADVEEAKRSPTTQSSFKRYSLNLWSTSTSPWLRQEDWQACREDFARASLAGRRCYAGLDLSKTRDMTALVLVFREEEVYRLLPFFWLPEDVVNDPDAPEYLRVWARQGHLEVTPGGVCDYAHVKRRVGELAGEFDVREVCYDPYNAEQLTQEIEGEFAIQRILFPQTITHFAEPTAEFERLVLSGRVRHNGHPVLAWQAGNVQVKVDMNCNKRPVKPTPKDPKKIDGIVAAVMGLARAMQWDGVLPGVETW